MLCSLCERFEGNPCNCCRTASRISWVLQQLRFHPSQEGDILLALRNCVGALSDLAETSGRAFAAEAAASGSGDKPPEKAKEEVSKEEPGVEAPEASSSARSSGKPPGEEKKVKKKEKKAKKEANKEEEKEEDLPRKERKRHRADEEKEPEFEEVKVEKKEESEETDREPLERKRTGATSSRAKEELESLVTDYVEKQPESFGLSSKRRNHGAPTASVSHRPREPPYPPPRRERITANRREETIGERYRISQAGHLRTKKSKGVKHRERGKEWRRRQFHRR